jgi:transposase
VVNVDETSWRQERAKAWLWATVTVMTTVFTIARNRTATVAQAVLGTQDGPIAVTDRFSAYDWIAGTSRQVCWSHLRRDFQARIDRGGAAEPIGRRLLRLSDRLFRWWHRLEDEEVDRERYRAAMTRLRREVKAALQDGTRSACATTGGSCAEILRVEACPANSRTSCSEAPFLIASLMAVLRSEWTPRPRELIPAEVVSPARRVPGR